MCMYSKLKDCVIFSMIVLQGCAVGTYSQSTTGSSRKINSDPFDNKNSFCQGKPTRSVYIVAGQSNATGLGKTSDVSDSHWLKTYWQSQGYSFSFRSFRNFKHWQSGDASFTAPTFGFDVSLAARLQTDTDQPFYMYKAAVGASFLAAVKTGNDWKSKNAGGIYDKFIADYKLAANEICDSGFKPVLSGFFWMQGESDATDKHTANQYLKNLAQLIAELQQDILPEHTPILLGKIRSGSDSLWPYADTVNAAMETMAANNAYVRTVETNDLGYYKKECTDIDGAFCKAHYNADGLIILGDRFYNAFKTIK
jgi:hypothetical protein